MTPCVVNCQNIVYYLELSMNLGQHCEMAQKQLFRAETCLSLESLEPHQTLSLTSQYLYSIE